MDIDEMPASHSPPSSPSSRRPIKLTKVDDAVDLDEATTAIKTQDEPSYRPDAKARRYDRQLRLWASAGQRNLEAARVLLIGPDATGCQALKNLVLPGIAHFTILSDKKVTPPDVATNFFLHPDSIGFSIAEQQVQYIKELNPAVEGNARTEDPATLLQSDPDFFLSFTLIIASNVDPQIEEGLAKLLWTASEAAGGPDIPLIAVRNSGFVGRIEVQLREHCIIDSHPDQIHTLRVDQPFEALEKYARELKLDEMDSMEHSHVPWVVLLARAVSLWKDQHGGLAPQSSDTAQRADFKALLKSWMQKSDEENFEEALSQAYRAWGKTELDSGVAALLKEPSVQRVTSSSKNLHILLRALSEYIQTPPHLPPISPKLPDMHSSTASYITLQNLYKQQFNEDLVRYKEVLSATLTSIDLGPDAIPEEEVEGFARNVAAVGIVKGTSLVERKTLQGPSRDVFGEEFSSSGEGSVHLGMHLAIIAAEKFKVVNGRWPGDGPDEEVPSDVEQLQVTALSLLQGAKPGVSALGETVTQAIDEVVRGGFGCLPNTAAFLGGIVAQEAIKLVTNQYNPLNNTVVADLVTSSLEKYRL